MYMENTYQHHLDAKTMLVLFTYIRMIEGIRERLDKTPHLFTPDISEHVDEDHYRKIMCDLVSRITTIQPGKEVLDDNQLFLDFITLSKIHQNVFEHFDGKSQIYTDLYQVISDYLGTILAYYFEEVNLYYSISIDLNRIDSKYPGFLYSSLDVYSAYSFINEAMAHFGYTLNRNISSFLNMHYTTDHANQCVSDNDFNSVINRLLIKSGVGIEAQ